MRIDGLDPICQSASVLKRIATVLLIAFALVSTAQGLRNATLGVESGLDFQWAPARALLHGVDPYAAFADGDKEWHHLTQYPNYPASGLVFLLPFGALDWPIARNLWALTNLVLTLAVVGLLSGPLARMGSTSASRSVSWRSAGLMLALLVSSTSWRNSLGKGQHGMFSLCLTLVAVAALHRHVIWPGLAMGAAWLKPTLGIPLSLYFARTRRGFLAISASGATHAALTVAAAAWVGSSVVDLLLGPVRTGQATTPRGRMDVFRVASDLGIEGATLPLIAAIGIGAMTFWCIRKERDVLLTLSSLSFTTLVVAFHSGYDFVIGIIPLAYAFREGFQSARAWYLTVPFMLVWFVDRPVVELVRRGLIDGSGVAAYGYHGFTVFIFYGAMVANWAQLLQSARSAPPGGPAGSGRSDDRDTVLSAAP